MSLTVAEREKRADHLAFEIISVLIVCGDLTAPGTHEALRDYLRVRLYHLRAQDHEQEGA